MQRAMRGMTRVGVETHSSKGRKSMFSATEVWSLFLQAE